MEETGRYSSKVYDMRDVGGGRWWHKPDEHSVSRVYERDFDEPFRYTINTRIPPSARNGAAHLIASSAGSHVVAPVTENVNHGWGTGYSQANVDGRAVSSLRGHGHDRFVEDHMDRIQQSALLHLWLGATDSHSGNAKWTYPSEAMPDGDVVEYDHDDVLPEDSRTEQFRSWSVPYASGRRLRPGAAAMLASVDPGRVASVLRERGFDEDAVRGTMARIDATRRLSAGGRFPAGHAVVLNHARQSLGMEPIDRFSFDWAMEHDYENGRRLLEDSREA